MFSSSWSICRLAVSFFCLLPLIALVSAADIEYCSSINTADTPKNSSIYQSNGLCSIFCQQDYAFAIVQIDGCWCSNYAPETTTTGCDRICPGYGTELCGGKGVFGYIELNLVPSGTKGAGSSSPTTTSATATVSRSPDPVTTTTVISPPISASTPTVSSGSVPSTITGTLAPTPIISLETVTGQDRTIIVTPTDPANSGSQNKSGVKLGVGGAVGLAVGLLALVGIVGLTAFFCLKKRRQQKEEVYTDTSRESMQGMGGPIPSRTMSENSRYVLGTDGRQVVETWETTNKDGSGKRTSRLIPVDPRLDPFSPVYQRGDNKSRESVNTIRDDHDYSRRVHHGAPILRATNPDE